MLKDVGVFMWKRSRGYTSSIRSACSERYSKDNNVITGHSNAP